MKRPATAPWIIASTADLAGLTTIIVIQEPWTLAVAAGLHLVALLPVALMRSLSASERVLAVSFVFALPLFGALLAVLALEHGNGDLVSDLAQAPPLPADVPGPDFGRLAAALPCCEALLAGQVEERRAIIATLTRRADADAVALLRWALGAPDPELAVEAALALEEMRRRSSPQLAAAAKRVAGPDAAGSGVRTTRRSRQRS